jgi:recombination protein RecT
MNTKQTPMEKAIATATKANMSTAASGKAAISAFNALLDNPRVQGQVASACSRHVKPERMIALVRTIVSRNPRIAECTPLSVVGCLIDCTQLGLEPLPQLGHVYLVPYRNWKTKTVELQLQLGYQGMIAMALRTGRYSSISAEVVRENDHFKMLLGSEEHLEHTYSLKGDRGEVIGAWAKAVHADGKVQIKPVTLDDIHKARALSKDWARWDSEGRDQKKLPVWEEHFDAMCRKTAVRRLFPFISLPSETQAAVQVDEAVEHGRASGYSDAITDFGSNAPPLFEAAEVVEHVDPETGEVSNA